MRKSQNIHSASASKGMHSDAKMEYQPQGTARFILNGVLESMDGDQPSLTNELGTTLCGGVKAGYIIIGAKQLDGDQFIIFSTNGTDHEIGLHNQLTCDYVPLINERCLGFHLDKRIKAIFRIFKGCERVIYFTDGINPYRVINIDSLQDYYTDGVFNCSSLELSRPHEYPCLTLNSVQDGGGVLPLGTYTFRLRLLDSDLNPTNWLLHTPTIPIVDESLSSAYAAIDGGKNLDSTDVLNGGVPKANKSIVLNLTDLDSAFTYYQLAVLIRSEATGFVNEAYILQPRAILSDTDTYVYTGPNPASDVYTQLSELTVDAGVIDIVEAHAQIDNRLFLANFSYAKYDYSAMQRSANNISSQFEISTERWGEMKDATAKSPLAYLDMRTFMRDEVYAFGIRGHHKKGWSTPVFHIPGREDITDQQLINLGNSNSHYRNFVIGSSGNWDMQLLTIVADDVVITNTAPHINLKDVRHLGYTDADINITRVPRWKVYNTGIHFSNSNRGLMAYYECAERYPPTKDCDGNYIYPTKTEYTPTGEQVTQPAFVRHHRFPDTTLLPIYTSALVDDEHVQYDEEEQSGDVITPANKPIQYIHPIGIVFDLSAFLAGLPQEILDDFTHWEVMVSPRDEYNKTVLDKGYVLNTVSKVFYTGDPDPEEIENEYKLTFPGYDPSTSTNPSSVSIFAPWCISPESPNERFSIFLSPRETFLRKNFSGSFYKNERVVTKHLIDFDIFAGDSLSILDLSLNSQTVPEFTEHYWQYKNRKINSSIYLDNSNPKDDVFSIYATDQGNDIYNLLYTKHILHNTTEDPLISGLKFSFTFDDAIINPISGYDNGISYAALKVDRSVYSNLFNISYRSMNACYHLFTDVDSKPPLGLVSPYQATYAGDVFITKLGHRLNSDQHDLDGQGPFTIAAIDDFGNNGYKSTEDDFYFVAFYESEINAELRHEAPDLDKKYLRKDLYQTTVDQFISFMRPEGVDEGHTFLPEYFGYNVDYSAVNNEVLATPLPLTYNFCSKCDNKFPFRIRYSEKSFQDQVTDKFKTFLPLNFTDLPGETLGINNLFVAKEELYAHTPRALYFIPTRAQTLNTNEATVYLGTGDIFAIPPRRIASPDYAYAGSSDAFATNSTEFGAIFIDPVSGKVFLLRDGLREISNVGQRNYFESNLKLKLNEYAKEFHGQEYPYLSPTHPIGIGYTSTFDTRHRRYIIHKRDYTLLSDAGVILSSTDGFIQKGQALRLEGSPIVRDESFTMSFSLDKDVWVSYHSYLPKHTWYSESNFFSTRENKIYKHNTGDYTTYYDNPKSDFIVELVSNPAQGITKKFGPIQLVHDTQIFDTSTQTFKDVYDITFDRGVFYGSDISTGLLTITPQTLFSSVTNNSLSEINFERKGRLYNINNILNVVQTDEPLFTKDWTIIQPSFFIDKVVNDDAIDFNKSLFTKSRMEDRFMCSRLLFNPAENIKITFEALVSEFKPSIR